MRECRLSIITINKNNREGILKTIASVVGQVEANFEYIVIDGNSTDGSQEIIQQYKDKLDYWESSPDSGIYNAMNKGIDHAHGDYLLFLNSGDWLVSPMVTKDIASLHLHADIHYSDMYLAQDKTHINTLQPDALITLEFLLTFILNHQNCLIKKDPLVRSGKYKESYKFYADYHYQLRLAMDGGSFCKLPFSLSFLDGGGISFSPKYTAKLRKELNELITDLGINNLNKKYNNWLKYRQVFPNYIPKIIKRLIGKKKTG